MDVPPSVLQKGSRSRLQILLVFLRTIFVSAIDVHKGYCDINVSDQKARKRYLELPSRFRRRGSPAGSFLRGCALSSSCSRFSHRWGGRNIYNRERETLSIYNRAQIVLLTLGFVGPGVGNDTDLWSSCLIRLRAGLRWGCGSFVVWCQCFT